MRHLASNVLSLLVVIILIALAAMGYVRHQIRAPGPLDEAVQIIVPKGANLSQVSARLLEVGAIDNGFIFRLAARYGGQDQKLKFGEYEFAPGASVQDILDLLIQGGNVIHKVVVPEGITSFQVAEILRTSDFLAGTLDTVPAEGSILPDTYQFERDTTRADALAHMQAAMDQVMADAWPARDKGLPLKTPQEALILASIVEKETAIASERARIAQVFINRLEKGMRLETDPTVIYGITQGKGTLGRGLTRSELLRETPYNTYKIQGLPPTPIANPGKEAIMAVLHPQPGNELFFVADGTGGHVFAKTLTEHRRNVRVWRQIEKEKNDKSE